MRLGIDVSNNNERIDWPMVSSCDVSIAVVKASEGTKFHDDYFHYNMMAATDSGLAVGAYHFGRPSANKGADEAQAFLNIVAHSVVPEFLVLDLEDERVSPTADLGAYALDFLETVGGHFKGNVLLYTSHGYARQHQLAATPDLGVYGLWIASWQTVEPSSFPPFARWDGWQCSDEGFIPGVGRVDVSYWKPGLPFIS